MQSYKILDKLKTFCNVYEKNIHFLMKYEGYTSKTETNQAKELSISLEHSEGE